MPEGLVSIDFQQQLVLPNKRYFTINEVSAITQIAPHVLRLWESEFRELLPIKRRVSVVITCDRIYLSSSKLIVC